MTEQGSAAEPLDRPRRAALTMLAAWMGERFYRTFRPSDGDPAPFDALLDQRGRRVGVTVDALWEGLPPGAEELERLLVDDVEEGGAYVVWVPPGAALPVDEPRSSELRLLLGNGLKGLDAGERREVRIPVVLPLAKLAIDGQYVSVTGGLSGLWTRISEGVSGAFHLDSREIHRLPEEEAEVEILLSRVRDAAGMLEVERATEVALHDYWLVSRLAAGEPAGVTVIGAPPQFDATEGAAVRRQLRRAVSRATEQRAAGECDFSALVVLAAAAHIEDEMATAALRGMSPAAYGAIDLIALAAEGQVRQVLQPRALPWEG